jgi:hypothetical protein
MENVGPLSTLPRYHGLQDVLGRMVTFFCTFAHPQESRVGFLVVLATVLGIAELFVLLHLRPLTDEEVRVLAYRRRMKAISSYYESHQGILKRRGELLERRGEMRYWKYTDRGGFYRDGSKWYEIGADGRSLVSQMFREEECTEDFTELLDPNRYDGLRMRLCADTAEMKKGTGDFEPYKKRGWVKPENPILTKPVAP